MIQEYVHSYGLRALIDRCGVLAGPWQMGKVDQGVMTLWVARHVFGRPLSYIGFGGLGKQVRDVLHVEDLFDLILLQIGCPGAMGRPGLQRRRRGRRVGLPAGADRALRPRDGTPRPHLLRARDVERGPEDLCDRLSQGPGRLRLAADPPPAQIVGDIRRWIEEHRETLKDILS